MAAALRLSESVWKFSQAAKHPIRVGGVGSKSMQRRKVDVCRQGRRVWLWFSRCGAILQRLPIKLGYLALANSARISSMTAL
ncbi:hypothetical protein MKFW12EY_15290 [Methylomonas koyamae]|nr:hypothetical protein MKFW12EY_15290 [Methylomonas koyamae]